MIYLVGGDGYIGTRVQKALDDSATVLDAGAYGTGPCVAPLMPPFLPEDVVVWLASFHREPREKRKSPLWKEAYEDLMIDGPLAALKETDNMVYVSSMLALGGKGIYAKAKRKAERYLFHQASTKGKNLLIVRPGTVYGGFLPGAPNRPSTAVNRYLLTGELPSVNWCSYITPMDYVVGEIVDWAEVPEPGCQAKNLDHGPPTDRERLREKVLMDLELPPEAYHSLEYGAPNQDDRAARRLRALYGLEGV